MQRRDDLLHHQDLRRDGLLTADPSARRDRGGSLDATRSRPRVGGAVTADVDSALSLSRSSASPSLSPAPSPRCSLAEVEVATDPAATRGGGGRRAGGATSQSSRSPRSRTPGSSFPSHARRRCWWPRLSFPCALTVDDGQVGVLAGGGGSRCWCRGGGGSRSRRAGHDLLSRGRPLPEGRGQPHREPCLLLVCVLGDLTEEGGLRR
jgi:hypothetical protein